MSFRFPSPVTLCPGARITESERTEVRLLCAVGIVMQFRDSHLTQLCDVVLSRGLKVPEG